MDPDVDAGADHRDETVLGANWFLNGHRGKLTVDLSRLEVDDPAGGDDEWRWRAQWEVTF